MAARVDLAVESSFERIRRRIHGGNPTEPDRVLSFFLNGLEEIENGWNAVLAPYGARTSVSGIFVHSTPKVVPVYSSPSLESEAQRCFPVNRTGFCELGDLLVIVTHAGAAPGSGVAILFQAKDGFPEKGDDMQRRLYEVADKFTYTSNIFVRSLRELPPKNSGALAYWDIELDEFYCETRHCIGPCSTTVAAADARLNPPHTDHWHSPSRSLFGTTIQKLVFANAGEPFSAPTDGKKGWNQIIRDLVEKTARRALTKRMMNTHGMSGNRGTEHLARILAADPNAPVVGRNSIAESIRHLAPDDDDVGSLGETLEDKALKPDSDGLEKYRQIAGSDEGGFWPPLKPLETGDGVDDDGGCNIVMIHCSSDS
jgi:hypothetical protein